MRKQYDEKLSENQIQKLLKGGINNDYMGGLKVFGGFKHSRNRLLNKQRSQIGSQNASPSQKSYEDNLSDSGLVLNKRRSSL